MIVRIAAFLFLSVLIYASTLNHPFVHDDIVFIQLNPNISRLDDWGQIFGGGAVSSASGINAYYRPILELVYRLEYRLFGFDPRGWHLVNILLHGLNGILLWRFLGLIGFSAFLSWAAAVLFIVHPVQVEAVACVAGISNLLMATFGLATLVAYLRGHIALSLGLFILALLTKEQAVLLLPLIVLIDRHRKIPAWGSWFWFFLLMFDFLMLRSLVTGGSSLTAGIFASIPELLLRLWSIAKTLFSYLWVLCVPVDLHYYRSADMLAIQGWWWLGVAGLGILVARSGEIVRFGACWFLLALLPVLNVVPLVNEYSFILTAEHFLYLPMAGIMIILVSFLERVFKHKAVLVFALATGLCAFLAYGQTKFWRNEVVLFERMLTFEPNFGRGHLLLAKAYYFQKEYSKADAHFARAYDIMDSYLRRARGSRPRHFYNGFKKGILFDWAHSLEDTGNLQGAIDKYRLALGIDPADSVIWNNLGVAFLKSGDVATARSCFQTAVQLAPNFGPAQQNLRSVQHVQSAQSRQNLGGR